MTTLRTTLLQAAELIEVEAQVLREGHTLNPEHNDWGDEHEAKAEYDACIAVANECRRHAGINYAEVECPDFERTSEHLITPELRAAIEGTKP